MLLEEAPPYNDETATSIIRRFGHLKVGYPHMPHHYECTCCKLVGKQNDDKRSSDICDQRARSSFRCGSAQLRSPRMSLRSATPDAFSGQLTSGRSASNPPPPKDLPLLVGQVSRDARRTQGGPLNLCITIHRGLHLPVSAGKFASVLTRCGFYEGQTSFKKRRKGKTVSWEEQFTIPLDSQQTEPLYVFVLQGMKQSEKKGGVACFRIENDVLHSDLRGQREKIALNAMGDIFGKEAPSRGYVEMSWMITEAGRRFSQSEIAQQESRSEIIGQRAGEVSGVSEGKASKKKVSFDLCIKKVLLNGKGAGDTASVINLLHATLKTGDGQCSKIVSLQRTQLGSQAPDAVSVFSPTDPLSSLNGKTTDEQTSLLFCRSSEHGEASDQKVMSVLGTAHLDLKQMLASGTGEAMLDIVHKRNKIGRVHLGWAARLDNNSDEDGLYVGQDDAQPKQQLANNSYLSVTVIKGVSLVDSNEMPLRNPSVAVAVGPMEASTLATHATRAQHSSPNGGTQMTLGEEELEYSWNQEMRFFDIADENGVLPRKIEVYVQEGDGSGVASCVSYGEVLMQSDISGKAVVKVFSTADGASCAPVGKIYLGYQWNIEDAASGHSAAPGADQIAESVINSDVNEILPPHEACDGEVVEKEKEQRSGGQTDEISPRGGAMPNPYLRTDSAEHKHLRSPGSGSSATEEGEDDLLPPSNDINGKRRGQGMPGAEIRELRSVPIIRFGPSPSESMRDGEKGHGGIGSDADGEKRLGDASDGAGLGDGNANKASNKLGAFGAADASGRHGHACGAAGAGVDGEQGKENAAVRPRSPLQGYFKIPWYPPGRSKDENHIPLHKRPSLIRQTDNVIALENLVRSSSRRSSSRGHSGA